MIRPIIAIVIDELVAKRINPKMANPKHKSKILFRLVLLIKKLITIRLKVFPICKEVL